MCKTYFFNKVLKYFFRTQRLWHTQWNFCPPHIAQAWDLSYDVEFTCKYLSLHNNIVLMKKRVSNPHRLILLLNIRNFRLLEPKFWIFCNEKPKLRYVKKNKVNEKTITIFFGFNMKKTKSKSFHWVKWTIIKIILEIIMTNLEQLILPN